MAEAEREVLERRRRYLIIRVDRADLSKNVLRGFTAFDTFLTQHPEFREQVTFIAHLQPSRQDVPEYAEYRERIEALVAVVNHRHGTTDWMPIDLRIYENFADAVARYKHYDLLMVNAIFDGMNLVAKEAPAVNTRDGVLMLSENTGSHQELWDFVISVNPFDIQEQADAIYRALTMDPEQKAEWAQRPARASSSPATPATGSTTSSPTSKKPAPSRAERGLAAGESSRPPHPLTRGWRACGSGGAGSRGSRRSSSSACSRLRLLPGLLRAPEPPPLGADVGLPKAKPVPRCRVERSGEAESRTRPKSRPRKSVPDAPAATARIGTRDPPSTEAASARTEVEADSRSPNRPESTPPPAPEYVPPPAPEPRRTPSGTAAGTPIHAWRR